MPCLQDEDPLNKTLQQLDAQPNLEPSWGLGCAPLAAAWGEEIPIVAGMNYCSRLRAERFGARLGCPKQVSLQVRLLLFLKVVQCIWAKPFLIIILLLPGVG